MSTTNDEALAGFIRGILTGSLDIGFGLMPLIKAYNAARKDPQWKEKGIANWLSEDPEAAQMLERVLTRVRENLPEKTRMALILALGGMPVE